MSYGHLTPKKLRTLLASGDAPEAKVVTVHIHNLRRKLVGSGYRIETLRGAGFRLTAPTTAAAG